MLEICGAAPPNSLNQRVLSCMDMSPGLAAAQTCRPTFINQNSHLTQDQPAEFTILIMIYFEPTSQANWKDTPLKGDAWSAVALLSGHHTANHQLAYFGSDCGLP